MSSGELGKYVALYHRVVTLGISLRLTIAFISFGFTARFRRSDLDRSKLALSHLRLLSSTLCATAALKLNPPAHLALLKAIT